jgi:tryptophan-rich sensory protein
VGALSLAGWIALSLAAGAIGAIASVDSREFYAALARPPWAPPGWLFGPVWTALYVLMGIAAWRVWRAPRTPARRLGLVLFVVQLALNALWTWIFFAWRSGAWAFAEIAVLWLLIVATIACFARVRPLAAWLLAPYIGWVTFALALTWSVWQRNPGQL